MIATLKEVEALNKAKKKLSYEYSFIETFDDDDSSVHVRFNKSEIKILLKVLNMMVNLEIK